jgi:hypothetical protein
MSMPSNPAASATRSAVAAWGELQGEMETTGDAEDA